ncbi:helix-turn-helix transcriptional regulator [Companilactobacillus musae]|uniref:helix-turn-helix domain-containing protein n=1 Tax=Companilactobacillus musae TaxID=1903258 RepID=UPI000E64EC5A|nr:helix-turn-helix transcriptional regulator [Companilactobacillus musae]
MFGQRLRALRISNSYTQASLSDKIGVSEKTIGTWERGTREPPMATTVKLADIFDVTLDYLYGRNETPQWAKQKDTVDLKFFLDRNLVGAFYDGDELTEEQKAKLEIALTQIFWDQRKKERSDTDDSNKRTK